MSPASELSNLITMKTAESEGVEDVGRALSTVCARRACESVEPIDGSKNVEGRRRNRAVRREDGSMRRAELPRRDRDGLRAAGNEARSGREIRKAIDRRRRERRHARQRRRTRDQSRHDGHSRTERGARRVRSAALRITSSRSTTSP